MSYIIIYLLENLFKIHLYYKYKWNIYMKLLIHFKVIKYIVN